MGHARSNLSESEFFHRPAENMLLLKVFRANILDDGQTKNAKNAKPFLWDFFAPSTFFVVKFIFQAVYVFGSQRYPAAPTSARITAIAGGTCAGSPRTPSSIWRCMVGDPREGKLNTFSPG
jgi:hypothetical protein